jgi:hypothetical protein
MIIRGVHTCDLCNVLSDDGQYKVPKHVAVFLYITNILLRTMVEKRNISQDADIPIKKKTGIVFYKI